MEAKLRRISEAGVLLLNFVFYSLEHKIKSEKYEEAKIILPEVSLSDLNLEQRTTAIFERADGIKQENNERDAIIHRQCETGYPVRITPFYECKAL